MNHAVSREEVRTKLSFAYTQTIIRLYPNNRVPILKLKRKNYDTISYTFNPLKNPRSNERGFYDYTASDFTASAG